MCPHCGAVVVGARRNLTQTIFSVGLAALLIAALIAALVILAKYSAGPGPDPGPKPDRPFEEHLP